MNSPHSGPAEPTPPEARSLVIDEDARRSGPRRRDCAELETQWVALDHVEEPRGTLTAVNYRTLPFHPVRTFFVSEVPKGETRGGHAHLVGQQLFICASGEIDVTLRRGSKETRVRLTPQTSGLLVDEGTWSEQRYLKPNSTLIVLCSHPYDPGSYTDDRKRT